VLASIEEAPARAKGDSEPTLADRWILARLDQLKKEINRLFDTFQYGEAGRQLYDFFWSEFADWYLEIAKLQVDLSGDRAWLTINIMVEVLDTCLRMLHPYIPFITEELWTHLKMACENHSGDIGPPGGWEEALIVATWPEGDPEKLIDQSAIDTFALVMDLIRAIRNVRAEKNVEPGHKIVAKIQAGENYELLESMKIAITRLAHLDPSELLIADELKEIPEDSVPLVVGSIEAFLPLAGMLDMNAETDRIIKELGSVEAQIARLEELLDGPFSTRAPDEVVAKEKKKLEGLRETAGKLSAQKDALSS
jgi:valyl-tRNA synthetase